MGQRLSSPNAKFQLVVQADGNVILREAATARLLWTTRTANSLGTVLQMTSDCTLGLYRTANVPSSSVWTSGTTVRPGCEGVAASMAGLDG